MSAARAPASVRRDVPIARLSTVRTGGSAEFFARAGSDGELAELLAWADAAGVDVNVVGSGSNLLIADEGVMGLVLKLDRDLARIEFDDDRADAHGADPADVQDASRADAKRVDRADVRGVDRADAQGQGDARMVCGGGARLPAVAAAAARAGLSGIEFGVNIPGTVGGAVRMNANAYGGELARALEWVEVVTASGAHRRTPQELGFAYRSSNVAGGEVVARACFVLARADAETVTATLSQMRERRHAAQPQGIKTFGSTFKNPDDPAAEGRSAGILLSQAGCNGVGVGGARFSPKHANFVENTGGASTADVLAVMAEGRRRVLERFGVALEPEVQLLGDVRLPWS